MRPPTRLARDHHHHLIEAIKVNRDMCTTILPITTRHRLLVPLASVRPHPSKTENSEHGSQPPVLVQIPATALHEPVPNLQSDDATEYGSDPSEQALSFTTPIAHQTPVISEAVKLNTPSPSNKLKKKDASAITRSQSTRARLPRRRLNRNSPLQPTTACIAAGTASSPVHSAPHLAPQPTSSVAIGPRRSQRKLVKTSENGSRGRQLINRTNEKQDLGKTYPSLAADGCPSSLVLNKQRRAKPRKVTIDISSKQSSRLPSLNTLQANNPTSSQTEVIQLSIKKGYSTNLVPSPWLQDQPSLDLAPPFVSSRPSIKSIPNPSSALSLEFSSQPLYPNLLFHFPPPTPSRHPPPPYPGPLPTTSASIHCLVSQPSQPPLSSLYRLTNPPPYPSRSPGSTSLFQPLCCTHNTNLPHRPKRPLSTADRFDNLFRTKKTKLRHLHFRSALILSTSIFHSITNSTMVITPDSRLRATSACFIPSNPQPRWISSPASADGRASGLCPNEHRWNGTGQGWQQHPAGGKVFYPWMAQQSLSPSYTASPPLSINHHPTHLQPQVYHGNNVAIYTPRMIHRPAPVSQAAPLKAQLLTILRMRSNMGPGEASLRFRKWVIWNAWTRREHQQQQQMLLSQQRRVMIPIIQPPPRVEAPPEQRVWTGNEVFDENGDQISSDEEEESGEVERVQTILLVSGHPTPPPSPVEESHGKMRVKDEDEGSPVTSYLGKLNISGTTTTVFDERPPTPPPSPPPSNVVGCHS
ncbi:hypothetical protein DFH28DRAFT_1139429 [Melampsora americana]|nr:hypothetical protein DFH28DRAFT_1139429 [Melampsora americana]